MITTKTSAMPPMISHRRPDRLRPPSATGACAGSGAIAVSDDGVDAASGPSTSVIDTLPGLSGPFPLPDSRKIPSVSIATASSEPCQPDHCRLGWMSEEAVRGERPLAPARETDPIIQTSHVREMAANLLLGRALQMLEAAGGMVVFWDAEGRWNKDSFAPPGGRTRPKRLQPGPERLPRGPWTRKNPSVFHNFRKSGGPRNRPQ